MVERRLREQGQRVRLLLGHRRASPRTGRPGSVSRVRARRPLVQRLAGRGQRLHEQRADLRRPAARGPPPCRPRPDTRAAPGSRAGARSPAPRPCRSTRRQPRTMRSTCAAVPARPTASSRSSVSGVATRVSARTLAYDSSPRASAWASRGSVAEGARHADAAPGPRPGRARRASSASAAQERKPLFQPPRASNSRMRSSRRAVAASRCADSSAISSPSRSSSATRSGVGQADGMSGEWISMASLPSAEATLHPGFGATWERPGRAMRGRAMIFASGPARPPITGPVRAAGPASAGRRRHSAGHPRRGCQAENAGGRAPPECAE